MYYFVLISEHLDSIRICVICSTLAIMSRRQVVQIAASGFRSAARFADGTVRAWGKSITAEERRLEINSRWIEYANIDEAFAPGPMWTTLDLTLVPETVPEIHPIPVAFES